MVAGPLDILKNANSNPKVDLHEAKLMCQDFKLKKSAYNFEKTARVNTKIWHSLYFNLCYWEN